MAYNLLKMVQLIMSAMDSDEVSDISETTESLQVVDIIEQTYDHLSETIGFPEHWDLFELDPSGDITKPTLMYIPAEIVKFDWIAYDIALVSETVKKTQALVPMVRTEFLSRMDGLDSASASVYQFNHVVNAVNFDIRGYNNQWPRNYTALADRVLLFDNYDADVETTLTASRSQGYGKFRTTFTRSNTYEFALDEQNFSLLFNDAMSACFVSLKQVQNAKAEQRARRAMISTQNSATKDRVPQEANMYLSAPSFGRKGRGRKSVNFGRN